MCMHGDTKPTMTNLGAPPYGVSSHLVPFPCNGDLVARVINQLHPVGGMILQVRLSINWLVMGIHGITNNIYAFPKMGELLQLCSHKTRLGGNNCYTGLSWSVFFPFLSVVDLYT